MALFDNLHRASLEGQKISIMTDRNDKPTWVNFTNMR